MGNYHAPRFGFLRHKDIKGFYIENIQYISLKIFQTD